MRMVRECLLAWDAIGVADIPGAADEYDCMISPLLHQLQAGVTEAELSKWISSERLEHFGLEADPAEDAQLVSNLKTMWERQIASP